MDAVQIKFNEQRYDLNSLLSNPQPENMVWRAQVIVRLVNTAKLLGLQLTEVKETP